MEAAPDRRLRRPSTRRASLPGVVYVVAAAVLWWAAATWREGTTYHLAPVVVTAAWAVADLLQRQERLTHTQAAVRLGIGTVTTLVVAVGLATTGRLDGPALVGASALAEAVLVTAVAIPLIWWAVTRGGRIGRPDAVQPQREASPGMSRRMGGRHR